MVYLIKETYPEDFMITDIRPFIGIALVVGFIVIIVLAVMSDKKANKKFKNKIETSYQLKERQGNLAITTNNEVMLYLPSGSIAGYKLWRLEDIVYVGMTTVPATNCAYCFMNEEKKAMKGEYLTPSKKPLLQYKQATFPARMDDLETVYQFIKKHKPDVKKCHNGTISE